MSPASMLTRQFAGPAVGGAGAEIGSTGGALRANRAKCCSVKDRQCASRGENRASSGNAAGNAFKSFDEH